MLTNDDVLQHGGKDGFDDSLDDETVVPAWQLMTGVQFGWGRIGYRFFQTAAADIDGFEIDHHTHAVDFAIFF